MNLDSLTIGELDNDSFFSIMKIFKNRSILKKIRFIDISLNKYLFDGKKYVNELIEFFEIEKSITLREIVFTTEIQITSKELDYILELIKKDNITYTLQFSKKFLYDKIIEKETLQCCNGSYNLNWIYTLMFCVKKKTCKLDNRVKKLLLRMLGMDKRKSINIKYI